MSVYYNYYKPSTERLKWLEGDICVKRHIKSPESLRKDKQQYIQHLLKTRHRATIRSNKDIRNSRDRGMCCSKQRSSSSDKKNVCRARARQTSLSEIFPLLRLGYSHLAYSATASSAGASVATGAAAFLPERRVRAFLAAGLAIFSLKSTNSMKHISAASPRRVPSLMMRV